MTKIILTGFKPFLGAKTNPSESICEKISIDGILNHVLPVDFELSFLELKKIIQKENPEYIIMLGLADGRKEICLEKIALNWNESKHPDESGNFVTTGRIDESQNQLALMTMFPINELYKKLENDFPVKISFSAGTYVCNNLYYKVLSEFPKIKSIFIHVPNESDMDLTTQTMAIEIVLKFLLENH